VILGPKESDTIRSELLFYSFYVIGTLVLQETATQRDSGVYEAFCLNHSCALDDSGN
jgi:hypothetical protein